MSACTANRIDSSWRSFLVARSWFSVPARRSPSSLAAVQRPPLRRRGGPGAGAAGAGRQRGGRGGRGAARTRKVVLAWADTRNGQAQHESVSHALAVIERLGYESGA